MIHKTRYPAKALWSGLFVELHLVVVRLDATSAMTFSCPSQAVIGFIVVKRLLQYKYIKCRILRLS
jgi:hypothetical protein